VRVLQRIGRGCGKLVGRLVEFGGTDRVRTDSRFAILSGLGPTPLADSTTTKEIRIGDYEGFGVGPLIAGSGPPDYYGREYDANRLWRRDRRTSRTPWGMLVVGGRRPRCGRSIDEQRAATKFPAGAK